MTPASPESCVAATASTASGPQLDDLRFVAVLEEYVQLLRSGQRPDRAEFLARYPEIAEPLSGCLDALDLVRSAAGDFARSGSCGSALEAATPPTMLGEFRIVREVGRGGMGVVYEAEQLPLGRRVALKVLPSAASLDPRQRQRFQIEAQAAALLHHEHIVPVFGIGFDQGVHYYAMQFIDGRPLTEIIRELRPVSPRETHMESGPTVPAPGSTTTTGGFPPARSAGSSATQWRDCRAVTRLGIQAALALEHAHDIGVIHRDIKPSNLLIDARGHLWVADFGLARLPHEDHDLTRTGDLVGTLRYMSPEQVSGERGEVDPRVDVYALGVTLYELLTLQPAFDARDRQELLRRILHDDPIAPRRINPSIPRDLETIVLKAISKEPWARYGSARALADDLRRFLDDQTILARRPGLMDRAVKWTRRHRAGVVAAASALVLTLAASTAVLWEAKRRTDGMLEAQRQAQIEARLALEYSLGTLDLITHHLGGDPSTNAPAHEEAKAILPMAIAYFDRIPKMFPNDDLMRESVAKAFRQSGYSRMVLGSPRGKKDYREAIRIYETLAAQEPSRIWLRTGLIDTLREYADLLRAPADEAEARSSTARALAVSLSLIDDETVSQPCFRKGLVGPLNALAWDLVRCPNASSSDAAQAVRLARRVVTWEPDLAAAWNTLGVAYYRLGDSKAATTALHRSMDLNNGGDAADWFFLAAIAREHRELDEARKWYERGLAWLERNPDRALEIRPFREEAEHALDMTASPGA